MIKLNNDQEAGLQALVSFLLNPEQKEYVLEGGPGRGKTTMLSQLISAIQGQDSILSALGGQQIDQVLVTATTNKAAQVIRDSMPEFGGEISTVHSALSVVVYDCYRTGKSKIRRTNNFEFMKNTLMIVDESSMVDDTLLEFIRDTTINCKVIYVGDANQLAPVDCKESPVFNSNIPTVSLEQSMRFQGNIELMCRDMEQFVKEGKMPAIKEIEGEIDFLRDGELEDIMEVLFTPDMPVSRAKILAFHNNVVNGYCKDIREAHGLGDKFGSDETVVCNSAYSFKESTFAPNKKEAGLHTEQLVKINRWVGDETSHPSPKGLGVEHILEYDVYSLEDCASPVAVAKHPDELSHALKQLYKQAKAGTNGVTYKDYFDLKKFFADLRFTQASTVHKSQGSTYDIVIVDLADITTARGKNGPYARPKEEVARLLNVACSRARERVMFQGDPHYAYKELLRT